MSEEIYSNFNVEKYKPERYTIGISSGKSLRKETYLTIEGTAIEVNNSGFRMIEEK